MVVVGLVRFVFHLMLIYCDIAAGHKVTELGIVACCHGVQGDVLGMLG